MLRTSLRVTAVTLSLLLSTAAVGLAQDAAQPKQAAPAAKAPAKAAAPAKTAQAAKPVEAAKPVTAAPAASNAKLADTAPKTESSAETDKTTPLKRISWPFDGMTGHLDRQAAQRGFYIYKQVCSACHSMNLVAYRSLSSLGFTEPEIKALAAEKQVSDVDDKGETIQRPGKPSDHIVPPYPNEDASRAANGGAYPPDLSLIFKAREGGGNYVYSLLTGFSTAPTNETPVANKYYNPYFAGHWISMPPPLSEGVVTYQDGTPATVDQMARDVVTFLEWTAEPEMEQRHQIGLKVLMFLIVMAGFFWVAKKRVWRNINH